MGLSVSSSYHHVSGQCQKKPSVGTNQMLVQSNASFLEDMKGHQATTQASASQTASPFHPLTMAIETLHTKGATNRGPAGLVAASVVS